MAHYWNSGQCLTDLRLNRFFSHASISGGRTGIRYMTEFCVSPVFETDHWIHTCVIPAEITFEPKKRGSLALSILVSTPYQYIYIYIQSHGSVGSVRLCQSFVCVSRSSVRLCHSHGSVGSVGSMHWHSAALTCSPARAG